MGRQKAKITLNNIINNTATPKNSDSTRARIEHSNTDKAKENDLNNKFRKMFEVFKEVMKNFLKEVEGKTNKN